MGRVIVACCLSVLLLGVAALAQDAGGTTAGTMEQFLPLIVLLVAFGAIFYFMLIRPQRKRQQQMNDLVGSLKRGDKVITAGGIHGEIESVGDTSVILILEDGAKLRIAKTSILRKRDK
jgi:preprotein translocase subunit YajC